MYIIEEQFDELWDWIVLRNRTGRRNPGLWCNARHIKTLTVFVHMCKHVQYSLANPVSNNPDPKKLLKIEVTVFYWIHSVIKELFLVWWYKGQDASAAVDRSMVHSATFVYVFSNMNMFSHLQHTFHAFLRLFPSDLDLARLYCTLFFQTFSMFITPDILEM